MNRKGDRPEWSLKPATGLLEPAVQRLARAHLPRRVKGPTAFGLATARCKAASALERAVFLVTVYEGYLSSAKNFQDARVFRAGKSALSRHLPTVAAGFGP